RKARRELFLMALELAYRLHGAPMLLASGSHRKLWYGCAGRKSLHNSCRSRRTPVLDNVFCADIITVLANILK
ncbi:hypothetical protein, partial [Campylobacter jejuni]|uniref:hypothetical protein n=1 Tax=Campylobacter jejuni TaxID=197 RepID=UPI0027412BF2